MSFLQYKKVISEGDVLIVCKVGEFNMATMAAAVL